ncbi:hypothetical protein [Streptacidiphilus carbonis]|uniref:hypothetical protein n=1 Tax=Streptacidiphilus carbonis TaxID=105422 RepID=UPI0005A95904|nr:hypothetical protein [Streptacidiphilus carbonis]
MGDFLGEDRPSDLPRVASLTDPLTFTPPKPVPNCSECQRYVRLAAKVAGDGSASTDVRVLLSRHLTEDHAAQ